jgi:HSP20 family protein
MKNGVLKLMVPKVKEEERKNVHEVKIEWGFIIWQVVM